MKTSQRGKKFVQGFEHCVLKAYADPKSGGYPWTCGWGSTRGVTPTTVWTQAEADAHFEDDIAEAERLVLHYVTAPMTQGQFDAFVSIFQNVGPGSAAKDGIGRLKSGQPSTLLRKFNAGDVHGAADEWMRWVSPGSNVENGLRRRRRGELHELYWRAE
jgi:lysozyme